MKVEMAEIGFKIRRLTIISIRKSYLLICTHPFLVGMFLFLLFMYRSFPFLFSILVSTSPVVICTFSLLGFLLSLGDPNIPEIEKEESVNHEITSLRTEARRDTTIVERDESFVVERYAGKNSIHELENLIEEPISRDLGSTGPLIEDYFTEIKSERREIEKINSDFVSKNDETVFLENQYSRIEEMDEESIGLLDTKSPVESMGSVIAEHGDSPPSSPWKQFGEGGDDMAGEDSDSDSDQAESSSPDASMADILPMLDELHPLLNQETPLVTRGSNHESDLGSNASDSDDESENHEEEKDEKGDESKAEITWTEDDQKNLMDLGTLEIERNQRLESLIARRRARKLMVEKNLIDLNSEKFDLPFSVTPISTTKKNPFDLAHDSNEFPGLPPVPGSAPSIMSQRLNPFDLPYDSSEEKPDLTDDNFQEEFSTLPLRETRFRRHESFNVGPSIFAPPKRARDDFRFRPYIVPEGSSYSSFQRQLSELSDMSKISSVPETESICSNVDQDDKKVLERDISQDLGMVSDLVQDPSELVGHGSESSEDEEIIELGQQDGKASNHENSPKEEIDHVDSPKREIDHDEVERPSSSLSRTLSTIEEAHFNSRSSSSSLSEEHERALNEKKDDVSSSLELDMDQVNELADENKEPVYDLSPSSSINKSYVLLVDQSSEMDKTVVSFSEREIDFCTQKLEIGTNDEKLGLLEDDHVTSSSLSLDNQHDKALIESDLIQEHSISEDQIHSSSSNMCSRSVSVENPKDELRFLDKPMADLSSEDREEEPPAMQLGSISKDQNLDQVHSQTLDSQNKSSSFHVQESYFPEGDEIKEIDEWIMELENVGDFTIGKSKSSSNEMPLFEARSVEDIEAILLRNEPIPMKNEAEINSGMLKLENEADSSEIGAKTENETVIKPIHEGDIDSRMHELVAASIQDINTAFKQLNDEHIQSLQEKSEADLANKNVFEPIHDEVGSGMHELEATSIQDIDTAFRQISNEEIESFPEKSEADVAEISGETGNKTVYEPIPDNKIDSGLHELEAASIQDIDTAFRQINMEQNVDSLDVEISEKTENKTVFDSIPDSEIDSGMHELEATSIQDIDTVFKQINDEEIKKSIIVESLDAEPWPEEIEADVAEIGKETESKTVSEPIHSDEIDSGLHELEATSIQDIDTAFRHINDQEIAVLPAKNEAEVAGDHEKTEIEAVFKSIHDDEIEATSIQDIDTAFRKIKDEEIKSFAEKSEADVAEISEESANKTVFEPIPDNKIVSGLHELEATSIQDIDTAFKKINDQESAPLPGKTEAEVAKIYEETEIGTVFKSIHEDEIDSAMHELEASSIQDIDAAFKQINDEEIKKRMIVDSVDAESVPEKADADLAEIRKEIENKTVSEPNPDDEIVSEMHEFEATSIEDINSVFRRIKENEIEKPASVESPDAESLPGKIEAEVSSIVTSEPPIFELRSIEKHNKIERFVTAVSDDFEPYILEDEDKPEEIYSKKHELDSTSVRERDELEDSVALEPTQAKEIASENEFPGVEARSIENDKSNIIEAEDQAEEISSTIVELDEKSVQDIDDAISQIKELENQAVLEGIDSGMKELETRSLEDLNLSFKKIDDEVIETSVTRNILVPEKGEIKVSELGNPELPVDELSIKESDASSSSIKEDEKPAYFEPISVEKIDFETDLKARSSEDIDLTLRNNIEDEIEKPVVVASLIADLAPEKSEGEVPEIGTQKMPLVEASSTEDIVLALKQVHESEENRNLLFEINKTKDKEEYIVSSKMVEDDADSNVIKEIETVDLEMKDFESRSIEDINLSLRDIEKEKEVAKPVNVASLVADLATDKSETDVAKIEAEDQVSAFKSVHTEETASEMKELEAQSLDDIESAFKQFTEKETEKPVVIEPLKAETRPEKAEAEISETCSSLQVESENKPKSLDNDTLNIETKSQEETNNLNSKFEDGTVGTKSKDVLLSEEAVKAETSGNFSKAESDDISSNLSDKKAKKKSKSHKSKSKSGSGSSSSSSSSSDSSDSD